MRSSSLNGAVPEVQRTITGETLPSGRARWGSKALHHPATGIAAGYVRLACGMGGKIGDKIVESRGTVTCGNCIRAILPRSESA